MWEEDFILRVSVTEIIVDGSIVEEAFTYIEIIDETEGSTYQDIDY